MCDELGCVFETGVAGVLVAGKKSQEDVIMRDSIDSG
jgi:hypothetical protein